MTAEWRQPVIKLHHKRKKKLTIQVQERGLIIQLRNGISATVYARADVEEWQRKESLSNNEEIFKYKREDKQRHEKFEETKEV